DELLRKSESAGPEETEMLLGRSYELLRSRKKFFMETQEALDQAGALEGRIAIVGPAVDNFRENLQAVTAQIEAIEKSPRRNELTARIDEISQQLEQLDSRIAWLTEDLKRAQADYGEAVEATVSLLGEAADNYEKVNSRSVRSTARVRMADCRWREATFFSSAARFCEHVGFRIDSMAGATEGQGEQALAQVAGVYRQAASDYGKKAMEKFDLAIETYSESSQGGSSSEIGRDIMKNHILALIGKMTLAEQLGQLDIADKSRQEAQELIDTAVEDDRGFAYTATARLFEGDMQYIAGMPVDNAIYFESLREQFERWKTLKREDREAEVNRLLELISELQANPSNDDEFNRMIESEKESLEKALAAGFEEEAEVTDPNYL
ncbi:MAG: hypothetical protein KAJ19_28560, partial [Gammaproteobacteria bacterium]|nr:hypothetical protein [Gammaproteobacteria bacterium]